VTREVTIGPGTVRRRPIGLDATASAQGPGKAVPVSGRGAHGVTVGPMRAGGRTSVNAPSETTGASGSPVLIGRRVLSGVTIGPVLIARRVLSGVTIDPPLTGQPASSGRVLTDVRRVTSGVTTTGRAGPTEGRRARTGRTPDVPMIVPTELLGPATAGLPAGRTGGARIATGVLVGIGQIARIVRAVGSGRAATARSGAGQALQTAMSNRCG
jgi:hypothetical protein